MSINPSKIKSESNKSDMSAYMLNSKTVMPTLLFIIVILVVMFTSRFIDPLENYLSLSENIHLTIDGNRLVFFNDAEYGPYHGSIVALNGSGPDEVAGFGYKLGVYYRYFKWEDSNYTLWTLMLNLNYVLGLLVIFQIIGYIGFRSKNNLKKSKN